MRHLGLRRSRVLTATRIAAGTTALLLTTSVALAQAPLAPERRGIGVLSHVTAPTTGIDVMRSLAVTDKAILDHFPFGEVMGRLAQQSGEREMTASKLYRRLWATQRPAEQTVEGVMDAGCQDPLYGAPYACPRAEGDQISDDPFADRPYGSKYVAIGLFNRIDLADAHGADCGEYRIIFARRSGFDNRDARVLINFEAVLPNPRPWLGRRGCRPVARLWRDLSAIDDPRHRARVLRQFYFDGVHGFRPVVHVEHYRGAGNRSGQIRTNQFMERPWVLREFRLERACVARRCRLDVIADTVKNAPFVGLLADPARPDRPSGAAAFQERLVKLVPTLAEGGVRDLGYALPDQFNSAQSRACSPLPPHEDPCQAAEDFEGVVKPGSDLWVKIQKALGPNSRLSPEHILRRAQALSCAGCHALSAGKEIAPDEPWPRALEFTHVSERGGPQPDPRDGVLRYAISSALRDYFLPFRATKLAGILKP